jgi:hemerythrin-like domain-containing protein
VHLTFALVRPPMTDTTSPRPDPTSASSTLRAGDPANPFGPTHKGIRWALCQLLLELGRVQAGNRVERNKLFDDLDGVLYLVERHIEHEERHVYPLLASLAPIEVASLTAQHRSLAVLAQELRQRTFLLEMNGTTSDAALDDLYLAFSSFVAEKLQHMHTEECSLAPKLVATCSAEMLRALSAAVEREMGPDEQSLFMRSAAPASRP